MILGFAISEPHHWDAKRFSPKDDLAASVINSAKHEHYVGGISHGDKRHRTMESATMTSRLGMEKIHRWF